MNVVRTVTRIVDDTEQEIQIEQFARHFTASTAEITEFAHAIHRFDMATVLSSDYWRNMGESVALYRLIDSTVYAESTGMTAAAAQEPYAWNFLPLVPWDDYGDVVALYGSRTMFASTLPIGALATEDTLSGYAMAYADELAHLKVDGASRIDVDFRFVEPSWIEPSYISITLSFTFDLDASYDGVTDRMICQFTQTITVHLGYSVNYLGGINYSSPLVASNPDYLVGRTEQAQLVSLDASVLPENYL
ncbi:MAG: hypothetical protein Q8N15_01330, partial [Bacillota bacterium]|nr:hypothetical protein [Bacillota bacterium]